MTAATLALTSEEVAAELRSAVPAAFSKFSRDRARDPRILSMSGIGGCTRAAAYRVAGVEPTDLDLSDEARAANLGTWEHEGLLPHLAAVLPGGATIEQKTRLRAAGLDIPGHLDLRWRTAVVDLKTVGEHRLTGVRRAAAPYWDHRVQVFGYCLGEHQAGRPVSHAGWLYMDRANGDAEIVVEPFTNAAAMMVIDRIAEIVQYADDPEEAPRDERGPGLSIICNGCPFLRRCWGPDAVPEHIGPQARLVRNDPDAIAAMAEYDDARQRESDGKRDKAFAAAKLSRTKFGQYGPWKYNRNRDGEQLDQKGAATLIRSLGHEPPMTPKRGALVLKLTAPLVTPPSES